MNLTPSQLTLQHSPETAAAAASTPRFAAPIWTLLLLAPFIAEVLSGSTRASYIFVYLPEVMVWGVGALLCRELVRRWRAGGVSLLLLALALSVAEEFIIQQTSIAPLPFPGSHPAYGRAAGINLVYLLFMLGFESVWVVLVPVQITELFFPLQAAKPWLRKRGLIASCIVFILGSRLAWFGWTQKARPRLHAAPYHPPLGMIALGLSAMVALIALAYLFRNFGRPSHLPSIQRPTISAWLAAPLAFVLSCPWWQLITQNFVPHPLQPFWIALVAGVAWAGLAFTVFVWLSSRPGWSQAHRFAACFGATLTCMALPYLNASTWPAIDLEGKIFFDLLGLLGFALLAKRIFTASSAQEPRSIDLRNTSSPG